MENRTHAIVAICFLVVLAAVAVVIFRWVTSGPDEPLAYRIVTSQSVAGLAPHSSVQFKGLQVGHVSRIRFDPKHPAQIIIDFHVRRGTYITHATYAVAAQHGLTGGKVLELKLGKGSREPLQTSADNPAVIPMRKGLLARLTASAGEIMKSVKAILGSAKKILDADNRAHLAATLKHLDSATAKLDAIETQLQPAVRQMPALVASLHKSIDQTHTLIANVNELAQQAQAPVKKLGGVEDSVQGLAHKLNTQTAPNIDQLSRSLQRTSRQLQALIKQLQARPQSLIFGPGKPPPGPGEPGFDAGDNNGDRQ